MNIKTNLEIKIPSYRYKTNDSSKNCNLGNLFPNFFQ